MLKQHAAQSDGQRSVAVPLYDADVNLNGSLRLIELPREYAG